MIGHCPLCGCEGDIQDSHIVPEFAYAPIYDERHKMITFHPLVPDTTRKIQKGLREPLLCRECEQLLNNRYERWFKELWFDQRPLRVMESRDVGTLSIPDYARFKLFHLSVLLRADLAKHAQWMEVDLGDFHRSRIKELVLSGDPGEPHEYAIVCCAIRRSPDDQRIWWDLVAPPDPGRMDGMRFYQFTFGGCGWMYYVSSHQVPLIDRVALKPDGKLPVIKREWGAFKRLRPHLRED